MKGDYPWRIVDQVIGFRCFVAGFSHNVDQVIGQSPDYSTNPRYKEGDTYEAYKVTETAKIWGNQEKNRKMQGEEENRHFLTAQS